MSRKQITILVTLTFLAASMWAFASRLSAGKQTQGAREERGADASPVSTERQPLPPSHMTYLDQQKVSDDELSHDRVLLVYITTSCKPCLEETEIISRLQESNPGNLRIYGISFERPEQVSNYVKNAGVKFPVLIDADAQLARSLDLHYFPSTMMVENGTITKIWRGVTRDEADLYRQLNLQ
jgi:peroxiredoxin